MSGRNQLGNGDVYERITTDIIAAIRAGAGEFMMPWHRGANDGFPKNAATGKRYHGINIAALWATSMNQGYSSPHWATYLQWTSLGAQVRKGEKGSPIVFYKFDDGDEMSVDVEEVCDRRNAILVRMSYVFNEKQVEGWRSEAARGTTDVTERLIVVEAFVDGLHADIRYGGTIAAYNPLRDYILMPERTCFFGSDTRNATESYYSTLLHEHVHWTGHKSRLNRDLNGHFGDRKYAMEELNAELGAAFLCAELAISVEPRQDHAAYVATWLSILQDDKTAILKAVKTATRAVDYMMKPAVQLSGIG